MTITSLPAWNCFCILYHKKLFQYPAGSTTTLSLQPSKVLKIAAVLYKIKQEKIAFKPIQDVYLSRVFCLQL